MSEAYGLHVRFTARPGQGDALAAAVQARDACRLYLVTRSADEPETVWVTEAWTDRAAHDASLEDPGARELIGRTMPLLTGRPEATELRPAGGKGY